MARTIFRRLKDTAIQALKSRWPFRLIGVVVFVFILTRIDFREAAGTLSRVDIGFVVLSLAIQGVALVIATIRWQLIMRRLEIKIPFTRALLQQLIGTSAAMVTPGQLGEFVKVLYLRRDGFPIPEAFLSVALDRILDLLMLLLFGFIALAILVGLPVNLTIILASAGSLAFVIGFLFLRHKEKSAELTARFFSRMSPKAYKETIQKDAHRLTRRLGEFDLKFLLVASLFTVANFVLLIFRVYAIVLALHLVIPFWYFSMVVPLLRLVGLVPISILGIGTRDLTAIYLFGQVGVTQTSALLISALGLITRQIQALAGLLVWWRYPLHLSEEGLPTLKELAVKDGELSAE